MSPRRPLEEKVEQPMEAPLDAVTPIPRSEKRMPLRGVTLQGTPCDQEAVPATTFSPQRLSLGKTGGC